MQRPSSVLVFAAAFLAVGMPALAQTDGATKFVIARAGSDATVLYDATPDVIAIVRDKIGDEQANRLLQHDALRVLALAAPELPEARAITVRITYVRSGDVSPVYGTPTFVGVERYASLRESAPNAKSDRHRQITFTVVGKLPPR